MSVRRVFWFDRTPRSARSRFPPSVSPSSGRYWDSARRPLACLLFVAPLLACYEVALWVSPPDQWPGFRNGAEQLARMLFARIGLSHPAALPAAIVLTLLTWQWVRRYPWRVSGKLLGGMLLESLLYAALLVLLGQLQARFIQPDTARGSAQHRKCDSVGQPPPGAATMASDASRLTCERGRQWQVAAPARSLLATVAGASEGALHGPGSPTHRLLPRLLAAVGAGLYEETVFRLWLLPLVAWSLARCGLREKAAWASAAVVCGVAFALAHHVPPLGEPLAVFPFVFRTTAGLAFAGLFLLRGFGITVGTHAAYDVFVVLLA